jgi:SAM-dependent methyltransferase
MKSEKDAYGQEILASLRGENAYEIVEREDGYFDVSPGTDNYFAKFNDWPKPQQEAIGLVKDKVLDIGAGAGRIALYLQKKGFEAVSIDNSPLAIKACKELGVKDVRVLGIENVEKLSPEVFDTVLLLGNNFGLLSNPKKAKTILKKLYKITSKKAIIVAESKDPYRTKESVYLQYQQWNRERGKMSGQLKIRIRFKKFITDWFEYLIVSEEEMEAIFRGTGWEFRRVIGRGQNHYIAIIGKES